MKVYFSRKLALVRAAAGAALACAVAATPLAVANENQLVASSVLKVAETKEVSEPLGVVLLNIHDFEGNAAQEARAALQLGERLQVYSVKARSVASKLGIQPGDVLMEINGIYVPKGKRAAEELEERVFAQIDWTKPIVATVLREGFGIALETASDGAAANTEADAARLSLATR